MAQTPDRLLLADGDERSLRVLEVSLRREGFEVHSVSAGPDAWSSVEQSAPDLIIADIDLPGMSGFELSARLRRRSGGANIPIILLAPDKALDQRIRALEVGADDYFVKPVLVKEIAGRVRALLQRRAREAWANTSAATTGVGSRPTPSPPLGEALAVARPLDGRLADVTVVDLLQLVEEAARSGIAILRGPAGAPACVFFRQGAVVDAEVGRLSGMPALSRLFTWSTGTFEFESKNIRRRDVIGRPTADLLVQGMRDLEEWNRLMAAIPDTNAIVEVNYARLAERLAEIPDEVNDILRLCDGVRTVSQVVEESALPDVEALTALIRLRNEGIVTDRIGGSIAVPLSAGNWPLTHTSPAGVPLAATPSPAGSHGSVDQSFARSLEAREEKDSPLPAEDSTPWDSGVRRRRTAPGLGQSPSAGASRRGVLDEATDRGPGTSGPAHAASPLPPVTPPSPNELLLERTFQSWGATTAAAPLAPGAAPVLSDTADVAVPPTPQVRPSTASPDAAPHAAPAAVLQTDRGFGPHRPRPSLEQHFDESASPSTDVHSRSADRPPPPEHSGRVFDGAPSDGPVPTAGEWMDSAPQPPSRPHQSARSSRGGALDQTVKVSYDDGDISQHDALDELGLPSQWRVLKFVAAALLLGTAAAVGVHHFRKSAVAEISDVPGARGKAQAATPDSNESPAVSPAASVADQRTDSGPSVDATASSNNAAAAGRASPADTSLRADTDRHADGLATKGGSTPAAEGTGAVPPPLAPAKAGGGATPPLQESAAEPVTVAKSVAAGASASASAPADAGGNGPSSSTFQALLAECRSLFSRNRMREAIAACTDSVAANPSSAEALTLLANLELNRGRMERADALATKAVRIDPGRADAYVIIGGVRQDSGRNAEAKEAYLHYLQLAPKGRYADELRSIVNSL